MIGGGDSFCQMLVSCFFGTHEFFIYNMREVIETVADSIAIEILDENNIITGRGNELILYSRSGLCSKTVVEEKLDIQLTNKVHGISKGDICNEGTLLVYGEKEFMLIKYKPRIGYIHTCVLYSTHITDWISCGIFVTDCPQLILCTAHSIILRFEYSAAQGSCVLKERISCNDKSTLYCAHLFGSSWSDIVVFAGNAFGELLVWHPSQAETTSKCAALLYRVPAHNGVIFSIDYDRESQQLITTSDDRAVKWWQVKFHEEPFCWSNSSLHAVASGYGHVARVFRGRIIKDGSQIYALSVGEDSYLCLWRNNGELLYKRRQQYGATIWNFAYNAHNKTVYTIGSIGNIVAYGLKHILRDVQSIQDPLLPQISTEESTEYIAKVKFLTISYNYTLILGITNQNRLMCIKKPNKNENDIECRDVNEWEDTGIYIDFQCTVMEVFSTRIAICGFKRMILIDWNCNTCRFEKFIDITILEGVIRTFVFFATDKYLLCDDKGNCRLFSQSWKERLLELPNCKEPWLTTALLLNADSHLVISKRQGNLLLYKISDDESQYLLTYTIKHPHGNLGATKLQLLNVENNEALLRSSGHDGAINTFLVDYIPSTMKFCSREIIPVSWVENIEPEFRMLDLFLGFNDNHFVVWCRKYDFLLQLPCGGGHRRWHFEFSSKQNQISLVFVKNKRLLFYVLPVLNEEQTHMPSPKRWHIAPCNKMVILEDLTKFATTIAVTAGDDNLIKIHTVTRVGLAQQTELHQHISNVRALKIMSLNSTEFLIFSGGGRAQMCVTKVNKDNFHVEELVTYTLGKAAAAAAAAADNKYQRNKEYNVDPETRVMALDVHKNRKNVYYMYIGCSDGYIRVLSVNIVSLKVRPLRQYFYNLCVLQIQYVPKYKYIVAAATDGKIRFFDSSLKQCLHELQHHSSGVNALSTFHDTIKKSLKILSGGDDQAVSYTELSLETFHELAKFHLPFLHTAQVCATAISWDGLFGYTSGVDQNVHKLHLTPDSDGDVVNSFHSCVADVKGVSLAQYKKCFIYGCGLQIFSD